MVNKTEQHDETSDEPKIVCNECEENLTEADAIVGKDNIVCRVCYDEYYFECHDCSNVENRDDECYIESMDYSVCSSCYDDYYSCDECGDKFHNEDGYYRLDNCYCSRDCMNEQTCECDECGHEMWNDDAYYNDDGCFCDDCYHPSEEFYNSDFEFTFLENNNKTKLDTKGYTIGVEIECINPKAIGSFDDGVRKADMKILMDNVEAKEDCSINGDNPVEFVTNPAENDSFFDLIDNLSKYLYDNSFDVNSSCGLHIHIGHKEGDKEGVLYNPIARHKILLVNSIFQDYFFQMLPKSRSNNSFCFKEEMKQNPFLFDIRGIEKPEQLFGQFSNRYNHINLSAWNKHNTIEIRSHSGTLSRTKIVNWARININIFEYARKMSYNDILNIVPSEKNFLMMIGEQDLIDYYFARKKEFNNKANRGRKINVERIIKRKLISEKNKPYSSIGNISQREHDINELLAISKLMG